MKHLYILCIYFGLLNSLCAQVVFEQKASQLGLTGIPGFGSFGLGVSHVDFNLDGYDDLTIGTEQGCLLYTSPSPRDS